MRTEHWSAAATERSVVPHSADDFLAEAVHELRAPVTVMVGAADTLEQLLEDVVTRPEVDEMIMMLTRNGRHLRRLIGDLLSSAFLERGTLPLALESVPLRPLLGWAVDAAGAADGEVTVECDPLLHAYVDVDRVEQIVTNLVSNALVHGAAPVTVTATGLGTRAGARVSVRDHGTGVSVGDRPHLFERFSSLAARRSSSTGLGLSIAQGLARAMGGDLVYAPGEPGSRFVLTLVDPDPLGHASPAEMERATVA